MYPRQDPEDVAQYIVGVIHRALSLVPEARVMLLVDIPGSAEPAGLFSQISYDRANALLRSAQNTLGQSRKDGLQVIASAMGAAPHG